LAVALSWNRRHRVAPLSRNAPFWATVHHVSLAKLSLGFLVADGYTQDCIGPSESDFAVLIPFSGASKHVVSGRSLPLSRSTAGVHSPGQPAQVFIAGYVEMMSVGFNQAFVVSELERALQHSIRTPVRFSPYMNLDALGGAAVRSAVLRLCRALDRAPGSWRHSLAVRQIERSLASLLLDAQPHNYTRRLHRFAAAGPWQVRAAEAFIEAHAHEPLTLADLASLTGVSARSLEYSFRRFRGCTPMEFLRSVRFARAHADLLDAAPDLKISDVAARWGFLHFGRFSRSYAKRFGELPSATLRRSV